jgi:polysaccharide biosynthesis transport protein
MNATDGAEAALLPTIWRQRWTVALATGACLLLCGLYLLVATPVYTIAARLRVHQGAPTIMSADKQEPERSDNYLYTEAEMLRSTPILALALAAPGTDDLKTFQGIKNRISFLKNQLGAEVGKKDDLISLSMESAHPDEAVRIVNNVVNAYVAYQSTEKRTTAGEVLSILQAEKAKRDQELAAKDAALRQFEKENHEVPLDGEKGNVVMQRLTSLSDAMTQATLQTLAAKAALNEALKASGLSEADVADAAMVSLGNTSEEQLRADLFVTRQRLEEIRGKFLPSHPVRQALESRVKQLSVAAVAVLRQRWITAQLQEEGLAKVFADQQQAALALKSRAAEYAKIKTEAERLRTQSDNLDNRIKEVSVAQSAGALNINVFEPALASDIPTKPAKAKLMLVAILMGLVVGAGLGVLREWLDPRVRSADEIKAALGLAVVGAIPRMAAGRSSEARGWAVHLESASPVAEAYRSVRTAVTFALDGQARTILITSPSRGEGKSTLASNLAIAMAKAGKRVLLIDCDFRSPVQHRIFGVSDDVGVASVLASGEPVEAAIRRTAVERLDVLPSGPVPKDPSEILNSEGFVTLIEGFAAVYDHVLIDSPATSLFNDARIVGATCDATLLVVRIDQSNRRLVEAARDGLQSVGAKIMGVVVNDIPGRSGVSDAYSYAQSAPTPGEDLAANEPVQKALPQRADDGNGDEAAWHADDMADAQA